MGRICMLSVAENAAEEPVFCKTYYNEKAKS